MSGPAAEPTPLAPPGPRCTHTFTVEVTVNASPDLDPVQPGTQVQAGMRVQLTGTAKLIETLVTCETNETDLPFHWLLSFQSPGGNETNITSSLQSASTLTPFFIANSEGTYLARLTGVDPNRGNRTAEEVITAAPPPAITLHVIGHVAFLLAHDIGVGGGFGPANDRIDVEVVARLDTQPGKSFGFQIRNDKNRPARQSMFDLLRDAFNNNWTVTLDGSIVPGKNNGLVDQITLTK